jgi:hypothetical protein
VPADFAHEREKIALRKELLRVRGERNDATATLARLRDMLSLPGMGKSKSYDIDAMRALVEEHAASQETREHDTHPQLICGQCGACDKCSARCLADRGCPTRAEQNAPQVVFTTAPPAGGPLHNCGSALLDGRPHLPGVEGCINPSVPPEAIWNSTLFWLCTRCGFEKRRLDGETAAPSCNGIEKDDPHGWCLMDPKFHVVDYRRTLDYGSAQCRHPCGLPVDGACCICGQPPHTADRGGGLFVGEGKGTSGPRLQYIASDPAAVASVKAAIEHKPVKPAEVPDGR